MTIKELKSVYPGSVNINLPVQSIRNGTNYIKMYEIYTGHLLKLTDEKVLNSEICCIQNIPGSTLQNGIPFLQIYLKY